MKQVVFEKPPYMNATEQRIADMHSLFNILNVLSGELSLLEIKDSRHLEALVAMEEELHRICRELKEGGDSQKILQRIRDSEAAITQVISSILDEEMDEVKSDAVAEAKDNIETVFSVVHKRLSEFEMRAEDSDLWVLIDADDFKREFEEIFGAFEKNAKGRYRIHFNLARKAEGDYYVDLRFDCHEGDGLLWLPLRLTDVLRDLAANARKYTKPGGCVALALYQDKDQIRVRVEDSGCGIPADELEQVAEFGYRATNVRRRPTMGGGFGLTKAIWLVTSWGGCLAIESAVDVGTKISFTLPSKPWPR